MTVRHTFDKKIEQHVQILHKLEGEQQQQPIVR